MAEEVGIAPRLTLLRPNPVFHVERSSISVASKAGAKMDPDSSHRGPCCSLRQPRLRRAWGAECHPRSVLFHVELDHNSRSSSRTCSPALDGPRSLDHSTGARVAQGVGGGRRPPVLVDGRRFHVEPRTGVEPEAGRNHKPEESPYPLASISALPPTPALAALGLVRCPAKPAPLT